jgi:hypothetical protein
MTLAPYVIFRCVSVHTECMSDAPISKSPAMSGTIVSNVIVRMTASPKHVGVHDGNIFPTVSRTGRFTPTAVVSPAPFHLKIHG